MAGLDLAMIVESMLMACTARTWASCTEAITLQALQQCYVTMTDFVAMTCCDCEVEAAVAMNNVASAAICKPSASCLTNHVRPQATPMCCKHKLLLDKLPVTRNSACWQASVTVH